MILFRYDKSVNTFYQIRYCLPKEPCKVQFRMEFLCRYEYEVINVFCKGTQTWTLMIFVCLNQA